jgi:hypothetical protein
MIAALLLAAEPSSRALLAERIGFGVTLVAGVAFFVWVAWLAWRK